jgi:hypothetical protein
MLDKSPEDFTKLVIAYSIDDVTIDELELIYSPQEIIDNCLAAIEYLVKDWHDAALMLKELVVSSKLSEHEIDYQPLIANSKLLEMSHNWLFMEPSRRKEAIIYVMGKLSDKQYLPLLNKAFEYYKDTDPFIMERLMFELLWLEDQDYDDKFNYLVTHENFVFRLTCIEAVQGGAKQGEQGSIDMLITLKMIHIPPLLQPPWKITIFSICRASTVSVICTTRTPKTMMHKKVSNRTILQMDNREVRLETFLHIPGTGV